MPEMDVTVDRDLASTVGLTERDVSGSLLASLVGTGQVTPSFYLDPKSGVSYVVNVQTPQREVSSVSDLLNTPILPSQGINQAGGMGAAQQQQLLSNLTTMTRSVSPQIIDHYNVQPTYDVFASVAGRDLGGVSSDIDQILAKHVKSLPQRNYDGCTRSGPEHEVLLYWPGFWNDLCRTARISTNGC